MLRVPRWASVVVVVLLAGVGEAYSQATASISGVVKDAAGGVVAGAAVVVKEEVTGRLLELVTGADGSYIAPSLLAGTYSVTASLAGFKTAVAKDIRVAPGEPITIPLKLKVGNLEETVTVTSSSELINTQTATVAATLNSDQLMRMPTPTRNALNTITFLPGVDTTSSARNSVIQGLLGGFVSITLDGVSNNDNFLRSTDAFFASVTPRQDAVEAVAVTMAAGGATTGGAGGGAVTMAFQTRSGGNRFTGSVYEFWRDPSLNTNYYFNEINNQPKNEVGLNQFGGRVGGPIMIPGLYDGRNKAFFFFHYEQIRYPNSTTRTRTIYNAAAADGWFNYQCGTATCKVNLLDLARDNKQVFAKDPTTAYILSKQNEAAASQGTRSPSDPLFDAYVWQSPAELFEHQPTIRLDYNLTANNRLSGSYAFIRIDRTPDYLNGNDPRFPNAPNQRDFHSERPLLSVSLRSTIKNNMTNELRGGATAFGDGSQFGYASTFTDSRNAPSTFADTGGFAILTPAGENWHTSNSPGWRTAPTYSIDDTVTWITGRHSVNFGGNYLISNASTEGQQMVPSIGLGFDTVRDPAASMFNSTNIPGASSPDLDRARSLYAMLTGRVTSVNSAAVLNPDTGQYEELGPRIYPGGYTQLGFFVQDSWRVSPALTLTGGLRWDVQTPFTPTVSTMSAVTMASICGQSGLGDGGVNSRCNFLQPGSTGGQYPEYIQLTEGTKGYNTDWNNFAPSASIAWRPDVQDGFLRALLGDPNQATVRAGYSVAFERQGLTRFTDLYGGNVGVNTPLVRSANTGNLAPPGPWPVFLSEADRLYTASFNPDPAYPILVRANRTDSLQAFAPDIEVARVQNWMIGLARSISKDTAVEIRYVGNRSDNLWSGLNYNAIRTENLIANGFFNEFKLAMANLTANNAAGGSRTGSFAYFGSGTGTNPLPIFLAYLTGKTDYNNKDAYTGGTATFASNTIAASLVAPNPNPTGAAAGLDALAYRTNGANAGKPANFWVLNPAVNSANVTDSVGFGDYHALQFEVRRRLSQGLAASVNYQYAIQAGWSAFDGFSYDRVNTPAANVRHAIKFQADWTLPFGRGQRFGADMSRGLDLIAGGWSVNAVGRAQTHLMEFGNVTLVGMDKDDLQAMYKYYYRPNPTTGLTEVWMLPEDVILDTRRAFSTSTTTKDGYSTTLGAPTPGGKYIAPANSATCLQERPGDCAPRNTQILAPWFFRLDFGATKRFAIKGRMNFEVRFDLLNLFDNINFDPVANPGSGATIFKVTTAYTDASNTYDPGGRIGQLMFRFNW